MSDHLHHKALEAMAQVGRVVLGKEGPIRLAMACLIARGHLLVEDLPGMGKTTLAQALARVLGLEFQRLQCTSDLLPADILGVSIFDREKNAFRFHPGPIFTQLLLTDEINRATPKTQSALLEAMEERRVTVEGETRSLPEPFFVIATQNPGHLIGTFSLPESQLDRFMMRMNIGYPEPRAERELLTGHGGRLDLVEIREPLTPGELLAMQETASRIHAAPPLLDYLQALLNHSRTSSHFVTGLSPRAGLSLLAAARAWAFLMGRDFLVPEDLQAVLPGVAGHRLQPVAQSINMDPVARLVEAVPIP